MPEWYHNEYTFSGLGSRTLKAVERCQLNVRNIRLDYLAHN